MKSCWLNFKQNLINISAAAAAVERVYVCVCCLFCACVVSQSARSLARKHTGRQALAAMAVAQYLFIDLDRPTDSQPASQTNGQQSSKRARANAFARFQAHLGQQLMRTRA